MKNMKTNKLLKNIFIYALLIFCSLLFLAPFYWMFSTSVKPSNEVFLFPPKWIPSHFKFENFGNAWQLQPFGMFLKNSLIVVGMTTVAQVFSSSLIAYGFARFRPLGAALKASLPAALFSACSAMCWPKACTCAQSVNSVVLRISVGPSVKCMMNRIMCLSKKP